jgi:hypothetical protein
VRGGIVRGQTEARLAGERALPSVLARPFRLIAFDWDGTAVASRWADAAQVDALVDALLGMDVRVAVITGTSFENVARQLLPGIAPEHASRLVVCANRGSEAFGFDQHGEPVLLHRRQATPEEDRLLDAVADGVTAQLERLTGLPFAVVRNRLNRRKIDLIPEPAFADPPKSAIGDLLIATEARLRGAGLSGGVREAFEMTERLARELGLEDARVTSDVKHIEVGLTDKADSTAFVFRDVAAPQGIAPAEVLVAGDEFGPIGGFEGSDHRMLEPPEAQQAVVISVGPEPVGVPPPVLHLGGGPERFCDVLALQIDVHRAPASGRRPR